MNIKIAYIVNSTDMSGGATKSLIALIQSLTSLGVEPIVVTPDKKGLYQDAKNRGWQTIAVPMRQDVYPYIRSFREVILFLVRLIYWQWLNYKAIKILYRTLVKEDIDIVHTNVSVMAVGTKLAQKLHKPNVVHFREYADKDFGFHYFPSKRRFMRRIMSSDSYVICITRGISHHHQMDDYEKSVTIYNGIIDNKKNKGYGLGQQTYFLYAGRISPRKGLMNLVKAYCNYAERVASESLMQLFVVGAEQDKSYVASIKTYINAHHQEKNVVFLGMQNDITELMINAKAIVIPSEFEAFGRCMPEAMACGCLCIGHDTGGTQEQFDNGLNLTGNEIGIRYNTVDELANILQKVSITPSSNYDSIRERAFQTVCKLYSYDSSAKSVIDLYKRITTV